MPLAADRPKRLWILRGNVDFSTGSLLVKLHFCFDVSLRSNYPCHLPPIHLPYGLFAECKIAMPTMRYFRGQSSSRADNPLDAWAVSHLCDLEAILRPISCYSILCSEVRSLSVLESLF